MDLSRIYMKQIWNIVWKIEIALIVIIIIAVSIPVLFYDQFKINGQSMEPTLQRGDHVLVNKLLMGARIYKKYDFSDPELDCFRLPGFRKIHPGDIAIFNYPQGWNRNRIEFKINYVYAKRCIGCPGDTVSIINGYYLNHTVPDITLGVESAQQKLRSTPDSVLIQKENVFIPAMPYAQEYNWSIRNFGPLLIPGKGNRIAVDSISIKPYHQIIEYETGINPTIQDGMILLGDNVITEYEFKENWYFFGGDNVLNSRDSRYIGLVPEDYIIGIAKRILFSTDEHSGEVRWERTMRRIE